MIRDAIYDLVARNAVVGSAVVTLILPNLDHSWPS
jgi:hypothetical protein